MFVNVRRGPHSAQVVPCYHGKGRSLEAIGLLSLVLFSSAERTKENFRVKPDE